MIELLTRKEGARIAELTAATGWLAHTTRATLTGLRKRGYEIELERGAFLVLWAWVIWDLALAWRRRVLMERYSKRHNLEA